MPSDVTISAVKPYKKEMLGSDVGPGAPEMISSNQPSKNKQHVHNSGRQNDGDDRYL